jgi:D-apionolactonase
VATPALGSVPANPAPPADVPLSPRGRGARGEGATAHVHVGSTPLGLLPPLGLQVASHGQPLSAREIDALRRLHLAHLRVNLDLTRPDWESRLRQAAAEAQALGAALEIEAVCGDTGAGIDALAATLASGLPGARVARVLVFPSTGVVTTEPVMRRARDVFRAARLAPWAGAPGAGAHSLRSGQAGQGVPLGGGTRADFVNANRAQLPVGQMDLLGYAINPQVHAFDNASLVETLAAQAVTVENARRIAGGKPVAVGPVTLRQRLNPAATGPEPDPAPDQLPDRVDPRQMSLFCAGWTLGSIRRLASAGAASLTYFETTGWLGVMERDAGFTPHSAFPSVAGVLFPVYHVFAAIGELRATGAPVEIVPVTTTPTLEVEALTLRAGSRELVLVANLTDDEQRIRIQGTHARGVGVRVLDELADARVFCDPEAVSGLAPARLDAEWALRPYGVALATVQP